MQFFTPACGTEFVLDEPWTFLLYVEDRNKSLFKAFGRFIPDLEWVDVTGYHGYGCDIPPKVLESIKTTTNVTRGNQTYRQYAYVKAAQVTFMPGTKLKVARVYIRNGQKGEFDSITLSVLETTHPLLLTAAGKTRKTFYGKFWVKLIDFNKINGTVLKTNVREHLTKE